MRNETASRRSRRAPAVVAVLEVGGEPRLTDVFVVGPACSPADEQLLRYARVPRP